MRSRAALPDQDEDHVAERRELAVDIAPFQRYKAPYRSLPRWSSPWNDCGSSQPRRGAGRRATTSRWCACTARPATNRLCTSTRRGRGLLRAVGLDHAVGGDADPVRLVPREYALAPHGVPHTYRAAVEGAVVVNSAPVGSRAFLREAGTPGAARRSCPSGRPARRRATSPAIAAAHG